MSATRRLLDYVRATVIGGALFLVPLFIIYFVLQKAVELLAPLVHPSVHALGIDQVLGIPGRVVVTLACLALIAFVAGVFARTRPGQALLRWIGQAIAMALPQFSMLEKVARSLDSESAEEIPVVLVATDAGWQLGLLLTEAHENWHPVFLPGSPQIMSGGVSYARADFIHRVDISLTQLWSIMRSRGAYSAKICAELAALDAAGKLDRP